MASALQNPNDSRRVNLIARAVVKKGLSPHEAVAAWLSAGSGPAFRRAVGMPRGGRETVAAALSARPQSKAKRAEYARVKTAVRKAFTELGGPAYGPTRGKPIRRKGKFTGKWSMQSYATRAGGTHASRYKKKSAKTKNARGQVVLDRAGLGQWSLSRQHGRRTGSYGKTPSGANRGHVIPWEGYKASFGPGGQTPRRRKASGGRARNAQGRFISKKNPFGDLALTNPSLVGPVSWLKASLPSMAAVGAAGAVHALATSQGLTAKVQETVAMIPGVGDFAAENLPYTVQGTAVGLVLALISPMVGGKGGRYLAVTGGAAAAFGVGIDAFNAAGKYADGGLSSDVSLDGLALGDLALTNVSALGDLALANGDLGNFGDLALTNGMKFAAAPLSFEDYGQASLADAYHSGADFSGAEGQALLNGKASWTNRYGNVPRRVSARQGECSHLAGREGHRWGWLIKTVGWSKAQAICAMPARQRVKVIAKLRKAAIASYNRTMLQIKAQEAEAAAPAAELSPVSGVGAMGATGAGGASNYLGDPALFMGA